MYKALEAVKAHDEAWPFLDPVEEEYAPNYYAVIRRPMDLNKLESRLDAGVYQSREAFEADFKLIVDNCKLYNGLENGKCTDYEPVQHVTGEAYAVGML